jgi:hypothetical protein
VEHLHDRDARVQADQVGERQRAHRMVEAELRDRVDRLGLRDALHQRVGGLVDERHQDPVRDEAGKVARLGGRLAKLAGELHDRRRRLVRRLEPTDDFDQPHHGHRVEEVHADHPVRSAGGGGQRRDRDGRRVGGQERLAGESLVCAPEHVFLHRGVLDHRLDHQLRRDDVVRRLDPLQHLAGIRSALLGQLSEASLHRRECLVDGARRCVVEQDAAAGRGDDLSDAAAHLTRADDENMLEAHEAGG